MMRFGADYYPEHWPESRWPTDACRMQEAGFNVIRMAEFAWAALEPEEGTYDFDWLDRAIALFGQHGIAAVLGTPTAIPPDWLIAQYPEILPVDEKGLTRHEGTRRHYRFTSEIYRAHCARIVRVMAAHYAGDPNVIGWQIDNEWGCHSTTHDYSKESQAQFQRWLRAKYGTLDELNRRWGTVFWSQTFHTWDSIPLPRYAPADHNPALMQDFYRWASATVADFQRLQVNILRAANPDWFITHNFMGLFDEVDGGQLSADLDFASWDNYPITTWGGGHADPAYAAFADDVTRGFKRRNFWVMEAMAGPTGAGVMSPTPRPGQIPFFAWQAIAHGADGMVFFRWRTCPFGAEQYWHGILDHDGVGRRRYREVAEMGAQIARIGDLIQGSRVPAEVALLRDFDSCWAYRIQGQTPGFSYDTELGCYHAALRSARIPTDVIASEADFSGYKLILAPALHLISEALAVRLRAYVEGGGVLLGSFRFGVKDPDNRVVERPLPGLLRDVFGAEVEEYDALGNFHTNHVLPEQMATGMRALGGHGFDAHLWADLLQLTCPETQVIARYALDYYAGRPAITLHPFGQGHAIYVGTASPDLHFYQALVHLVSEQAGITPTAPELHAPPAVEIAPRVTADGQTLLFILNGSREPARVTGTSRYVDRLSSAPEAPLAAALELAPWGVALLCKIAGEE